MKERIIKNLFNPSKYFKQNYMKCLGTKRCPCLFGPRRSGMSVQMDPLGTSSWDRLFYGEKLWLLFSLKKAADILGLHDRHW